MTIFSFSEFQRLICADLQLPLLCLDWGKRIMGVAISDHQLKIAMPLKTFSSLKAVWNLHQLWQMYKPQGLVIGLPLSDLGIENKTCTKIRRFANILPKEWPILFFDEHLSSYEAISLSREIPCPQKERMDDHAAAIVLQEVLGCLFPRSIGEQHKSVEGL